MNNKLTVASSPHVHSPFTTQKIMLSVILALAPAGLSGAFFLGFRALSVIFTCIAACVISEYLWQLLMKQRSTINDLSAVVTGLLLAYNLPVSIPLWMAACGSVFAIIIVKQFYGGIGCNIVNPALAARAMMLISWPVAMTTWTIDGVSSATPLALMKGGISAAEMAQIPSLWNMLVAMNGCIGETSSLLLFLGGAYLIYQGIISWRIPVVFILTTVILGSLFNNGGISYIFYGLFSGGLLLGAFFMATDYTTSPMTPRGHVIFAFGCGLLTALIRTWGGYPEGVSFSILIMNIAVPIIDKYTRPRILGEPVPERRFKFNFKNNKKQGAK